MRRYRFNRLIEFVTWSNDIYKLESQRQWRKGKYRGLRRSGGQELESLRWKARKAKRYHVCEFAIQPEDPITKPIIQAADEKLLIRKSMRARSSRVEIILSSEYIFYAFVQETPHSSVDCAIVIVAFSLLLRFFSDPVSLISAESCLFSVKIWFSRVNMTGRL